MPYWKKNWSACFRWQETDLKVLSKQQKKSAIHMYNVVLKISVYLILQG